MPGELTKILPLSNPQLGCVAVTDAVAFDEVLSVADAVAVHPPAAVTVTV